MVASNFRISHSSYITLDKCLQNEVTNINTNHEKLKEVMAPAEKFRQRAKAITATEKRKNEVDRDLSSDRFWGIMKKLYTSCSIPFEEINKKDSLKTLERLDAALEKTMKENETRTFRDEEAEERQRKLLSVIKSLKHSKKETIRLRAENAALRQRKVKMLLSYRTSKANRKLHSMQFKEDLEQTNSRVDSLLNDNKTLMEEIVNLHGQQLRGTKTLEGFNEKPRTNKSIVRTELYDRSFSKVRYRGGTRMSRAIENAN